MSSYVEHDRERRKAGDGAEAELKKALRIAEGKEKVISELVRMIESFGLGVIRAWGSGLGLKYAHPGIKPCPTCGSGRVFVEELIYEPGKWIVACDRCRRRTEGHEKVKDALRAWHRDQVTEDSELMAEKLKVEEMSEDGAKRLVEAITESAAEEYLAGLRTEGKPSVESAWFFEGSDGALAVLRRRAMEGEEEAEKARGR